MRQFNFVIVAIIFIFLSSCVSVTKRVHRKGVHIEFKSKKSINEAAALKFVEIEKLNTEKYVTADTLPDNGVCSKDIDLVYSDVSIVDKKKESKPVIPQARPIEKEQKKLKTPKEERSYVKPKWLDHITKQQLDLPLKWSIGIILLLALLIPYLGFFVAIFNLTYFWQMFHYYNEYDDGSNEAFFSKMLGFIGFLVSLAAIAFYLFFLLMVLFWII